MDKLNVIVKQETGTIRWNFEELKNELSAVMEGYVGRTYDDNAIAEAKADVAYLRKFKKEVEKRRIEIKNRCLEPYSVIEAQAKQLIEIVDKPIAVIDRQVKDYEDEQRQKRKAEILKFFEDTFSDIDEDIARTVKFKYYDSRWENATASKKSWKDAISDLHESVTGDLAVIDGVEEEFVDEARKIYKKNVNLGEAMRYVQNATAQKARILEAERRRQEEARRIAEEAERRRLEDERRKAEEAERIKAANEERVTAVETKAETGPKIDEKPIDRPVVPAATTAPKEAANGIVTKTLVFTGTEEQFRKVCGYIKYTGARYEVR